MPIETVGDNTGDNHTGVVDTFLASANPTSPQNAQTKLSISKYDFATDITNSLIKFTGLSSISGPVTVSSATLGIHYQSASNNNQTVTLRACLRNWVESEATWNNYSTGNAWQTPGGLGANDRDNDNVLGTFTSTLTDDYHTVSTAALAQWAEDVINGTIDENLGIHFERTSTGNTGDYWDGEPNSGPDGERPYLIVDYTVVTASGKPSTAMRLLLGL